LRKYTLVYKYLKISIQNRVWLTTNETNTVFLWIFCPRTTKRVFERLSCSCRPLVAEVHCVLPANDGCRCCRENNQ